MAQFSIFSGGCGGRLAGLRRGLRLAAFMSAANFALL